MEITGKGFSGQHFTLCYLYVIAKPWLGQYIWVYDCVSWNRAWSKHEWEETGGTGMAQLIVIAVLHRGSDLIKIHIVNGKKKKKKACLGVWERHFYFKHNLHYIKLSVFTPWKCWHKLRVTHKASLFFKYIEYRMHKKAYKRWKHISERQKKIQNTFY